MTNAYLLYLVAVLAQDFLLATKTKTGCQNNLCVTIICLISLYPEISVDSTSVLLMLLILRKFE